MHNFQLRIYVILLLLFVWLQFVHAINEAPAKVSFKLQISKLSQDWINDSQLKSCVDKGKERCFWKLIKPIVWDGEQYIEIMHEFLISNMATNLSLDITIEHLSQKINYPKKPINLTKFEPKTTFELHSYNLESFVTVTVNHECEVNYYPPRQCTKACFPVPNESKCDGSGDKICNIGFQYDAKADRCIGGNCINIRCENGRCINKAFTFECVCLESYYGKLCELRNPCFPNPCSNNGQCKADPNTQSFKCSCPMANTDDRCIPIVKSEHTKRPVNRKCLFSSTGAIVSCPPETGSITKDVGQESSVGSRKSEKLQIIVPESKKSFEWNHVSMTTTIVAAVGCSMLILCLSVSIYVCYFTRDNTTTTRNNRSINSPTPQYPEFMSNRHESSFKRSLSLDDNSAYMPPNCQMLPTLPNNFTMSSTGYSLHTNSYQDNGQSSSIRFPSQGGFIYQPDHTASPLLHHHGYHKSSIQSTTSSCGAMTPPTLPPRSNDVEMSPFGSLPKPE